MAEGVLPLPHPFHSTGGFVFPQEEIDAMAAETVMEEFTILQVIDRARGNNADAKRVDATPAALSSILPDHSSSSWTHAGVPVAR